MVNRHRFGQGHNGEFRGAIGQPVADAQDAANRSHVENHTTVLRSEYGPTHAPGNLSFIEADGSLRAGHEVWNEF